MNPTSPAIDARTTVNETISRYPETVEIFKRYRIDACCGGSVPLREAALRNGADPDALWDEIQSLVEVAE